MTINIVVTHLKNEMLSGKEVETIKLKINQNATLRDFFVSVINGSTKLKQVKHFSFLYCGFRLKTSALDQKLTILGFGSNINANIDITDGTTLDKRKNMGIHDDKIFNVEDLINLREQHEKNIETNKTIKTISPQTRKSTKTNWPLLRIIIGVIDLLLLLGTIVTSALFFLPSLSLSIVWPIVLFGFFVVVAVILFAWSKILPESWLKKMNLKTGVSGKGEDKGEDKDKVKIKFEEKSKNNDERFDL